MPATTGRTVTVLVVLALAGCGGDSASVSADAEDTATTATTADGGASGTAADESVDTSGGSGDTSTDASDFPIPAPAGIVLDALVDAGLDLPGQRQLYYANDDFDRIVAFYDDWTDQNGEWSRGEADRVVLWSRLDGDSIQQITVSPDEDAGAQAEGPLAFLVLVSSE